MAGSWRVLLLVFLVIALATCRRDRNEVTTCVSDYKCVPLTQCRVGNPESDILYPCHSGLNKICCPPRNVLNATTGPTVRQSENFPLECGIVENDDKISGGRDAAIGQFPWAALLGYKTKGLDFVVFLCGGSVVTSFYVLTAAHCLFMDEGLLLEVVRLGELDLNTEVDCENHTGTIICADPHVDIPVDRSIPHPGYNKTNLKNDIALVKVKRKIVFTDYVQPICLPFERQLETRSLTNEKFVVSGWGKIKAGNLGGAEKLQFATVIAWDQKKCAIAIPPDVRPLDDRQLCANGKKTEDACKGDSGGPLINTTLGRDRARNFQVGIVSFASTQTCGNPELPTVYTRVDHYLQWIVDNVS